LADLLGFDYLDTGAMYRAVALIGHRDGLLHDAEALARRLESLELVISGGVVLVNGDDVTAQLRDPEVTRFSSVVAAQPAVRAFLVRAQRQAAFGRRIICEGRDQGTVVFPDALCKFFLTADPRERARRRSEDMGRQGKAVPDLEALEREISERDMRDANRAESPMVAAADADHVDTTSLLLEDVLALLSGRIQKALSGGLET
jgi:cytidylate kinase